MAMKTFMILLKLCCLPLIAASSYQYHSCSNTTYATNGSYQTTLLKILDTFSSSIVSKYRNASLETSTGEVIEALYQCRGDVSLDVCQSCVVNATISALRVCPNNISVVIWNEECILRYSNESIFGTLPLDKFISSINSTSPPGNELQSFTHVVSRALHATANEALSGPNWGFMAKETDVSSNFSFTDKIYTMVQCTGDLPKYNCSFCLLIFTSVYPKFWGESVGGYLLFPSCFFRFEIYKFYNTIEDELASASPLSSPTGSPPPLPVPAPSPSASPAASPSKNAAMPPSQPVLPSIQAPSKSPPSISSATLGNGWNWKGKGYLLSILGLVLILIFGYKG